MFEQAYQERTTIRAVMVRLGAQVDVPATRVSAPHLDVTLYATDQIAALGPICPWCWTSRPRRPSACMHPASSAIADALVIDPQPGLLVRSTLYPASTDCVFPRPLQEHVPVFQGAFGSCRTSLSTPRARESGAEDDGDDDGRGAVSTIRPATIGCFNPQSVALKWTLAVKPLDRERAK
ncbi:MAG: hypothetical protein U0Q12_03000 [Vicinamibacterales bacterium]